MQFFVHESVNVYIKVFFLYLHNKRYMSVLGIDPSINHIGWAIINNKANQILAYGIINSPSSCFIEKKLAYISNKIETILQEHKAIINSVSIESSYVNKNFQTSLKLAFARGAILATLGKSDLPILEYSPAEVKKTFTGKGNALKKDVEFIVKNTFNFKNSNEHINDAIAIAYTHYVKALTHINY